MGTAYTPGLTVNGRSRIEKLRRLPLKGQVVVQVGAQVMPDTVIARTELPGDVALVRAADKLGITGEELLGLLTKQVGDSVAEGELLAETPGLFGRFFRSQLTSPISGVIETITARTGNLAIRRPPRPVELTAYVRGTVKEVLPGEGAVIETLGALVQGIFGIGGERHGTLSAEAGAQAGSIIIVPGQVSLAAYRHACDLGAVAIVGGSVLDSDLRAILGRDIGVAITGEEDVPASLLVTEGFGDVAMAKRTWALLSGLFGRQASVSGATQIRAGVIRPEIIVPDPELVLTDTIGSTASEQVLDAGTAIRLIREPYFGALATVDSLPPEPIEIGSGAMVRVLRATLADGSLVTVPRANVEIVVG
ncbi:MAG: hypothetical protein HZB16_09960 [Armatimonadetes bacterium]|nr:hypothetical protein [Armatimonadota bacterium]